jgi:hypothetical protein
MGRPNKSEPRDRQLNLSLTTAEYESLVRRAQAVGMRPVHFGRALIFDQSRKILTSSEISNVARLNLGQLVRLGNNLNQMMRHLHQTGEPVPPDLEPLLKDIRQILARGAEK